MGEQKCAPQWSLGPSRFAEYLSRIRVSNVRKVGQYCTTLAGPDLRSDGLGIRYSHFNKMLNPVIDQRDCFTG
jgi:hypothetical protein